MLHAANLSVREEAGNVRELTILDALIDFSSNDYLGLARSEKLSQAFLRNWQERGSKMGSTGSRLLSGNSRYAQELEESIASFHGYEASLLFNTGYMANVGLHSSLPPSYPLFFDSHIHTSCKEGIRLRRGASFPFRHQDLNHLEWRLKRASSTSFISVESIYSTDGSLTALQEIAELSSKYGAHLIVDEAHATGVYGPEGKGLVASFNLMGRLYAQVTTFGKALGVQGAVVLGDQELKKRLLNFAASFIYTTAPSYPSLAAIQASYQLFPHMEKERGRIFALIDQFRASHPAAPRAPIQTLLTPGNREVKKRAKRLMELGYDVRPLMSPTVQRGCESLRLCLHAFNTDDELRGLLCAL